MEANELRIGNVINLQNKPIRVNFSTLEKIIFSEMDKFKKYRNQYKPIELTEEILLKCGFKSDGLLYEFRTSKYVLKSDFEYVWVYDVELKSCICVKCKHLHQLQNLYFALTNEELEINS